MDDIQKTQGTQVTTPPPSGGGRGGGAFFLALILLLATLPWLGLGDFYTRGSSREAIVAQTMLAQHNWVLPTNNGGEMAYKPPFMHWCIAALSAPLGDVNTWTARLPSALSCVAMCLGLYLFVRRREGERRAMVAALATLASFEVFRAASSCRVDMVLTACIVGAMLLSPCAPGAGRRAWRWLGFTLLMSLGCLTKGPVAIVLPCGVAGLWAIIERRGFWARAAQIVACAAAALVLPALWYYAAYQQGGDEFLALVREENIDRFLGHMSYASHENGLWYYFAMLPAGLLPWTLLVFLYRPARHRLTGALRSPLARYFLLCAAAVFVFYCIPKSKRGVYILPVYPFVAYFVAKALDGLFRRRTVNRLLCAALVLYTLVIGIVVPLVMSPKSDRRLAAEIARTTAGAPLTSYIHHAPTNDPPHFFTLNYYLHNRLGAWSPATPRAGYIIIGEQDVAPFRAANPRVRLTPERITDHRSCDTHQRVKLYRYTTEISLK